MHVKKGKSIGAQRGLADKLNEVFAWYDTRRQGKGFEFDTKDFNATMYNVLIEAGPGINIACGGDGQPYVISMNDPYGGGRGGPTAWQWDAGLSTFINPYYQYNRRVLYNDVSGGVALGDGDYYLRVNNSNGDSVLTQEDLSADEDLDLSSSFWIAEIQDGQFQRGICSTPVLYTYES